MMMAVPAFAQETDSLSVTPTDTSVYINADDEYVDLFVQKSTLNPKKAALLSAVLPGAGQVYNKQYWKLPFIYGGAVIIGHYIRYQDRLYASFRSAYFARTDLDPRTVSPYDKFNISSDVLLRNAEQLRRDRDYLMIIGGIFYLLQIVDAHVSAHLHEFSVNEALSVNIRPTVQPSGLISQSVGVSFSLRIK